MPAPESAALSRVPSPHIFAARSLLILSNCVERTATAWRSISVMLELGSQVMSIGFVGAKSKLTLPAARTFVLTRMFSLFYCCVF